MVFFTLHKMESLVAKARDDGGWYVVVVPDGSEDTYLTTCCGMLFLCQEKGDTVSGRTLRTHDGGMVSVVGYTTPVVTNKKPFNICFLNLERVFTTPPKKKKDRKSKLYQGYLCWMEAAQKEVVV